MNNSYNILRFRLRWICASRREGWTIVWNYGWTEWEICYNREKEIVILSMFIFCRIGEEDSRVTVFFMVVFGFTIWVLLTGNEKAWCRECPKGLGLFGFPNIDRVLDCGFLLLFIWVTWCNCSMFGSKEPCFIFTAIFIDWQHPPRLLLAFSRMNFLFILFFVVVIFCCWWCFSSKWTFLLLLTLCVRFIWF